jgi:hypothetical protein
VKILLIRENPCLNQGLKRARLDFGNWFEVFETPLIKKGGHVKLSLPQIPGFCKDGGEGFPKFSA